MTDRFESARAILHEQIEQRQTELDSLFAAYEKLGGTYHDETAVAEEPEEKPKLLTGPKAKKSRRKKRKSKRAPPPVARGPKTSFRINGQSIEMNPRHRDVLEILESAAGVPVAKRDLASCFGGQTPNWNQTQVKLNETLAGAGVKIVNVHGAGWKLEKLA